MHVDPSWPMDYCYYNENRVQREQETILKNAIALFRASLIKILNKKESFYQRGSNFDNVFFYLFLVDEGIQIPLKAGHRLPATETPFKWRCAGVPMMTHH